MRARLQVKSWSTGIVPKRNNSNCVCTNGLAHQTMAFSWEEDAVKEGLQRRHFHVFGENLCLDGQVEIHRHSSHSFRFKSLVSEDNRIFNGAWILFFPSALALVHVIPNALNWRFTRAENPETQSMDFHQTRCLAWVLSCPIPAIHHLFDFKLSKI